VEGLLYFTFFYPSIGGKVKYKTYSNNPHTVDELKIIHEIIICIEVSELKVVSVSTGEFKRV
jgi:hypothetical protein